jgi:hypothetical protein
MASYANPNGTGTLPNELSDYFLGYANPQAGFYNYLSQRGLSGLDSRSQFAQAQYGDEYQRYLAQKPNNVGESFMGYLSRVRPDYQQQLQQQGPQARGINTSVTSPRVRWNL